MDLLYYFVIRDIIRNYSSLISCTHLPFIESGKCYVPLKCDLDKYEASPRSFRQRKCYTFRWQHELTFLRATVLVRWGRSSWRATVRGLQTAGTARISRQWHHSASHKKWTWQHVCLHACVLPEVGDLLLSISTDCWLSESSVRPVGADEGKKVKNRHSVRLF